MEFALSTHLFVGERLSSHILDQILGSGFRQIEIFCARQHFDYHDVHHVRDVAQWFSDHGIKLYSLHAPLYDDFDWGRSGGLAISIAYQEKRPRINSMDEIKRAIEVAEQLPFRFLIQHMGLPGDEYDLSKFDALMTSIEHLGIFAKERGAEILLENIPNELSSPPRLLEFIRYTRRVNQRICFDTGHAHLTGGVAPAFEVLGERVASTHVHDNHSEKDDHLLPFGGDIDWNETIRDFRTRDGQFPMLFELRQYGPEVSSLAHLRQVMEKIEALH